MRLSLALALSLCTLAGCALTDDSPETSTSEAEIGTLTRVWPVSSVSIGGSGEAPATTCGWLSDSDNCYALNQSSSAAADAYCESHCGSYYSRCVIYRRGTCEVINGQTYLDGAPVSPEVCWRYGRCEHLSGLP